MVRKVKAPRNSGTIIVRRYYFFAFLAGAFALVLVAKLFTIQILSFFHYQSLWQKQSEARLLLPSKRGEILDRFDERLAYTLEKPIGVAALQQYRSCSDTSIVPSISHKGKFRYRKTKRIYPFGHLAGQTLGFLGYDGYGLAGIEYAFDDLLRGKRGWAIVGCDGKNRKYPLQGTPRQMAEPGYHIRLSIDARLQSIVENALQEGIEKSGAKRGMALVLSPQTGEVLAMASCPFFNPNMVGQYESRAWKNLCIAHTYEPGSTFKIVTAGSAIEEAIKTPTDLIDGSQGVFTIYEEEIHDHKPFGLLTFREALAYSSNVCFAKVAKEVGSRSLYRYARAFGFGSATGIKLPGEESGTLHSINLWSGRTLVTMAIGHEVSGTLLQAACAFAAIANGGVLMQPVVVKEILDPARKPSRTFRPKVVRRIMSEKSATVLTDILVDVVRYGTGRLAGIPGVLVAGKTGTAEKIDSEKKSYIKDRVMASFIGFAPANNAQLLCAVTLDEPTHDRTGGRSAAPIFREIISRIIHSPRLPYAEKIVEIPLPQNSTPSCFQVPDFVGMDRNAALYLAQVEGLKTKLVGKGDTVIAQIPEKNLLLPESHEIALVTDRPDRPGKQIEVPSVVGKSVREALQELVYLGLHVKIRGNGRVVRQSIGPGTSVQSGTHCLLECQTSS